MFSHMNRRIRTLLIRGGLVLTAAWCVYSALGRAGDGTLRVSIVDKATGQSVPAMVCITSVADNTFRRPPDGNTQPAFSTIRDFHEPAPWSPGDIGLPRAMNGDIKGRMGHYEGGPAYPFWREPASYFVTRPFSITLPAGKWRLAVAKGFEYLPMFEEFNVVPNQSRARTVRLERWVDMARQGWYSADTHLHYPRSKPEHDEFLISWAQAEDVRVLNVLSYCDIKGVYLPHPRYGKESWYQRGGYWLVSGHEGPRENIAEQGHVLTLNIKSIVRDPARYHLYDVAFDGVHAQGGLVGYAHVAWAGWFHRLKDPDLNPTWDPSINTIRNKVDFFEILQFRHLGLVDYYDFLNLGVKLAATAGSDMPWGGTIGEVRTYAYTGRDFSLDAWFAALKQGRTFVTNGPMLSLTANNAMPGDEVRVRRNATVRIRARAWAPEAIGAPKTLEIVSHGRVIRSAEAQGGKLGKLELQFDLRVNESQWIAARVTSSNGAVAHTSPVYVVVDGESFADRKTAPEIVERRLKVLDFVLARLHDEKFTRTYGPGEVAALTERIEDARKKYAEKLRPAKTASE